jgi:hypothetical protein
MLVLFIIGDAPKALRNWISFTIFLPRLLMVEPITRGGDLLLTIRTDTHNLWWPNKRENRKLVHFSSQLFAIVSKEGNVRNKYIFRSLVLWHNCSASLQFAQSRANWYLLVYMFYYFCKERVENIDILIYWNRCPSRDYQVLTVN